MGNCPPSGGGTDDGGGGGDGDNDDNNDHDDDDDSDDDDDDKTSTTCTTTYTATYESVFCSVTKGADTDTPPEESDCSTLAYTTSTSCETITGSTTTTLIPQETEVKCTPDTCGGNGAECPVEKRDSRLRKRMRAYPEDDPEPGDWSDPAMYGGDTKKFMRGGKRP